MRNVGILGGVGIDIIVLGRYVLVGRIVSRHVFDGVQKEMRDSSVCGERFVGN